MMKVEKKTRCFRPGLVLRVCDVVVVVVVVVVVIVVVVVVVVVAPVFVVVVVGIDKERVKQKLHIVQRKYIFR
jgi:hypothetical protein